MSTLKGRIAVDVQFADATTAAEVQSLKTLSLQDATEYSSGKVAVVSGTCGTSAVNISFSPTTYRDADGAIVSFSTVTRIAFAARGNAVSRCADWNVDSAIYSQSGRVAVTDVVVDPGGTTFSVNVAATAGTASYTLVMYGS